MTEAAVALAGLAGSVQIAVLGRIGVLDELAFATGVQLLLASGIAVRGGVGGLGGAFRSPASMRTGGAAERRSGLLGVNQTAISWPRALGTRLLGVGAAPSLVR